VGGKIALEHPDFLEFAGEWTGEALKYMPRDPRIVMLRAEALLLRGRVEEALPLWRRVPNEARAVAASVICAVAAGQTVERVTGPSEAAVNQECLAWLRRLVPWGAGSVIMKLDENVQALRMALPAAADTLQAAFSQAREPRAV